MAHATRHGEPLAHFERMMTEGDPEECWPWPYAKIVRGYGTVRHDGRTVLIHRLAFFRAHGRWPVVGRHDCDNPPCFNPWHILDGSHADNARDRDERGRSARGGRSGRAILTDADIPGIRASLAAGESCASVARRLDVDRTTISCIKHGRRWTCVPIDPLMPVDA